MEVPLRAVPHAGSLWVRGIARDKCERVNWRVGAQLSGTDLGNRLEVTLKRLEALEASFAEMQTFMKEILIQNDAPLPEVTPVAAVEGRVTVCAGKDCRKQGSAGTLKRMKEVLQEHPEMRNVSLKTCKCLGECGKGPTVSMKFGKGKGHIHKKVKSKRVDVLIAKEIQKAH